MLAHRAGASLLAIAVVTGAVAAFALALGSTPPRDSLAESYLPRDARPLPKVTVWSAEGVHELAILRAVAMSQPACHPVPRYPVAVTVTVANGEARFSEIQGREFHRHRCAEQCRADALETIHLPTRLADGTSVALTLQ